MSCLLGLMSSSCFCLQEAQVTLECAIPQRFHRSVMGPKGCRIQQITRDYNVQIKFPDREENPGGSVVTQHEWVSGLGAQDRFSFLPACGW